MASICAFFSAGESSFRVSVFMPAILFPTERKSNHAVNVRYPGDDATKRDAQEALRFASVIRREVRHALGLKG